MFYFWIYHLISQLHICIDIIFIELFYNHFQVKQNITVIIHCLAVHVQKKNKKSNPAVRSAQLDKRYHNTF